ncbi:hypothetical protein H9P43_005994 [Blastocladiella emersonii ATCC 22665]|nr:hypothetical protein H9P43_005994 [Blastocladiella emersonii ATCC 22665]
MPTLGASALTVHPLPLSPEKAAAAVPAPIAALAAVAPFSAASQDTVCISEAPSAELAVPAAAGTVAPAVRLPDKASLLPAGLAPPLPAAAPPIPAMTAALPVSGVPSPAPYDAPATTLASVSPPADSPAEKAGLNPTAPIPLSPPAIRSAGLPLDADHGPGSAALSASTLAPTASPRSISPAGTPVVMSPIGSHEAILSGPDDSSSTSSAAPTGNPHPLTNLGASDHAQPQAAAAPPPASGETPSTRPGPVAASHAPATHRSGGRQRSSGIFSKVGAAVRRSLSFCLCPPIGAGAGRPASTGADDDAGVGVAVVPGGASSSSSPPHYAAVPSSVAGPITHVAPGDAVAKPVSPATSPSKSAPARPPTSTTPASSQGAASPSTTASTNGKSSNGKKPPSIITNLGGPGAPVDASRAGASGGNGTNASDAADDDLDRPLNSPINQVAPPSTFLASSIITQVQPTPTTTQTHSTTLSSLLHVPSWRRNNTNSTASRAGAATQQHAATAKPLLPPLAPEHAGRKCLVLDLDETLVHSSFKLTPNADIIIPVMLDGIEHSVYVLKRPGLDTFMKAVGEKFETVIHTASLAVYGQPVIDMLDKYKVVQHRLFRESCVHHKGNYVKDLSMLGRDLRNVIIIDNSPASYLFHRSNAIPITSWFNDPNDTELLDLIPFLMDLERVDDVRLVLGDDDA